MLTPFGPYQLKIFGGDVFDLRLNWKDNTGALFDLTGYHARLRFFTSKTDRTVQMELTDGSGITLGDGSAAPNIYATIASGLTIFTTPPTFYILEIQEPGGNWQRFLSGNVRYRA